MAEICVDRLDLAESIRAPTRGPSAQPLRDGRWPRPSGRRLPPGPPLNCPSPPQSCAWASPASARPPPSTPCSACLPPDMGGFEPQTKQVSFPWGPCFQFLMPLFDTGQFLSEISDSEKNNAYVTASFPSTLAFLLIGIPQDAV